MSTQRETSQRVAEQQLPRAWTIEVEPGVNVGQIVRPIESIGCYIPGGRYALVSTLVMTVVPARSRACNAWSPSARGPMRSCWPRPSCWASLDIARIGGAQAIAALAYGTKSIPRVEKIFGPGNRFVTAAKQLVSSDCAIDLPAGPTEAVVLAARGNARWIAADLLAQAEHAPDAGSFFVTTSQALAERVQAEVARAIAAAPANAIPRTLHSTNRRHSACTRRSRRL